jgi:hypothetical protein
MSCSSTPARSVPSSFCLPARERKDWEQEEEEEEEEEGLFERERVALDYGEEGGRICGVSAGGKKGEKRERTLPRQEIRTSPPSMLSLSCWCALSDFCRSL